jgi:hypothetical protein
MDAVDVLVCRGRIRWRRGGRPRRAGQRRRRQRCGRARTVARCAHAVAGSRRVMRSARWLKGDSRVHHRQRRGSCVTLGPVGLRSSRSVAGAPTLHIRTGGVEGGSGRGRGRRGRRRGPVRRGLMVRLPGGRSRRRRHPVRRGLMRWMSWSELGMRLATRAAVSAIHTRGSHDRLGCADCSGIRRCARHGRGLGRRGLEAVVARGRREGYGRRRGRNGGRRRRRVDGWRRRRRR